MNREQISGKFDQAAGKIKQKTGEALGNQNLANKGVADQVKGAAKETWGRVKDTAHEISKTSTAEANAENDNIREKIASSAQNVKDKIGARLDDIDRDQRQERENIP